MITKEILTNLLKIHDLNILEYKDWLLIDEQLPAISASLHNEKEYEDGGVSIQLNIHVLINKNQVIQESFIGIGKDKVSAIQNAFHDFSINSFHVFLSSFWNINNTEQVGIEEWEINGQLWNAYIGNFGCKGNFNTPETLFNIIEEQIKSNDLSENIYWFRSYYANMGDGNIIAEGLKNNIEWEELSSAIKNITWPKSNSFYSLRNFIILRKK